MENKRLANRVKQLREAQGYTQGQLAIYAKLSRAYISHLEMGAVKQLKPGVVQRIATALRTTPEDLLQAAGYISPPEDIPALDDPELIVYLNEIGNFPKHDQEIIKGVLRGIREAQQKYGKEND